MATTDEEKAAPTAQTPPAPQPAAAEAKVETTAAAATTLPGVSNPNQFIGNQSHPDIDRMAALGGNRKANDEVIADGLARGNAAGLPSGNDPSHVADASRYAAHAKNFQAAVAAASPAASQPSASSSVPEAASRLAALPGMNEIVASLGKANTGPMHDVPAEQLGTGTPPPAHVIANTPSEPQMARA